MDIKEIISRQRELYINDLLYFYKEKTNGVKEVMIELKNEEPIREFKLYRLDYFEKIEEKFIPTELNSNKYLDFVPIEYNYGVLEIELNPFYWHGCEFILKSEPTDNNWLIEWTKKWIDKEEKKQEDSNGLSGVIHNVTKLHAEKGNYSFSVDFGSADTEAFFDLIDEIYNQGIKEIRIGSFTMIETIDNNTLGQ